MSSKDIDIKNVKDCFPYSFRVIYTAIIKTKKRPM